MCDCQKDECRRPEELMAKPRDCSSEQIRKCHGDVKNHPCAPDKKED